MCYKCVPVSGGENLLQQTVVPSVRPLHRSASHIATIDIVIIIFSARICNMYFLPLHVCLICFFLVLEKNKKKKGITERSLWYTTNFNGIYCNSVLDF